MTDIMNSDISGGSTAISFKVDSFLNPYSGVPKSGFSISTADSSGFVIDQRTSLSITVTEWATFLSASFNRGDSQSTVNEPSAGIVLF